MNRDDIIRMAREAGFICLLPGEGAVPEQAGIWSDDANVLTQFERFAALVIAAQRHPGYIMGEHWLQAAYTRICTGETEAEVMADYGWQRESR
jgi:hypothetical protein